MSTIVDLLGGGLVKAALEGADKLAARWKLAPDKREELKVELEKIAQAQASEIEESYRTELGARERVIVAELEQEDRYVKRMRPTIGYAGVAIIAFNYVLIPVAGWTAAFAAWALGADISGAPVLAPVVLPWEFWVAWGGYAATYSLGRSFGYDKRVVTGPSVTNVSVGRGAEIAEGAEGAEP